MMNMFGVQPVDPAPARDRLLGFLDVMTGNGRNDYERFYDLKAKGRLRLFEQGYADTLEREVNLGELREEGDGTDEFPPGEYIYGAPNRTSHYSEDELLRRGVFAIWYVIPEML